ncbi:MAG: hypothetical protein C4576_02670 [Desulfobacteraceae bacterium]|nr:MAG: hypothetical protein C4576_02670 [Desulfobacteraceae bacterium]
MAHMFQIWNSAPAPVLPRSKSGPQANLAAITVAPTALNSPAGSSDALRIHYYVDIDKKGRIECRKWGSTICRAFENYKHSVPRAEVLPDDLPGLRSHRDESLTLYYEYYCPGCFTLLDVEVAGKDSPPLWDIQLKTNSYYL